MAAHGKQQAQAKQSPDILPWMLNASRICFLQYMPMQGNMAQSRLLMSMAVSLSANLSASPSSLPSTYSSSSSCLPPIAHPSIRSPSRPSTTSSSGCYSSVFLRSCQHCCLPTSSTRLRRTEQSRSSWFRSRPSKRTTLSTKTCCYLTLTAPLSSPSSSIRISCHLHSVVRSVSFSHSDLRALTFSMNSPSISACSSAQSPGLGRHYAF
mmetsp:Transcript_30366/g.97771  ORF Transcript_30366/g.97771 Transcript_30366/m.97771 type:complete len:209 (+) Transcript_30366:895-1521(+)